MWMHERERERCSLAVEVLIKTCRFLFFFAFDLFLCRPYGVYLRVYANRGCNISEDDDRLCGCLERWLLAGASG